MSTQPITSPLPDDAKEITGAVLQASLTDLIDLSLIAKQAHWNVVGRNFREAHLHLDELVDMARLYTDMVAERAATIGVSPDGRPVTVAKTSGIRAFDEGWRSVDDVTRAIVEILAGLVGRFRERIDQTDQPDPITQDMLIGLTGKLEEAHWMWQAKEA